MEKKRPPTPGGKVPKHILHCTKLFSSEKYANRIVYRASETDEALGVTLTIEIPKQAQQNSRRNRVGLQTNSGNFRNLINEVGSDYLSTRNRSLSAADLKGFEQTITCILVDLLAAREVSKTLWIGYSRGKRNFVKNGSYWDSKRRKSWLSHTHFLGFIDYLRKRGLIENFIAPAGAGKYSSRMKAKAALNALFDKIGADWTFVQENITTPQIVVKDDQKRIVSKWPDPGEFDLSKCVLNLTGPVAV